MARRSSRDEPEFTESSRRIFARIRSGVAKGKTGRQIQRELREEKGFNRREKRGFANAAFWRAHRKAVAIADAGRRLKFSRGSYTPPLESIPINPFIRFRTVHAVVRVEGVNVEGEPLTKYVTVASDRPISKDSILKDAFTSIEEDSERYGFDMDQKIKFTIVALSRRDPERERPGRVAPRRRARR